MIPGISALARFLPTTTSSPLVLRYFRKNIPVEPWMDWIFQTIAWKPESEFAPRHLPHLASTGISTAMAASITSANQNASGTGC